MQSEPFYYSNDVDESEDLIMVLAQVIEVFGLLNVHAGPPGTL